MSRLTLEKFLRTIDILKNDKPFPKYEHHCLHCLRAGCDGTSCTAIDDE